MEHSDPSYTRANEVMESREKNLFDGVERYLATGEIDESMACVTYPVNPLHQADVQ